MKGKQILGRVISITRGFNPGTKTHSQKPAMPIRPKKRYRCMAETE
ncbi:MAG: hypothetical protein PF486_08280 [Prolixibacteraceae bacterium]|nr:hypothetical protein [Prolixibacteraceae bacterium]